MSSQANTSSDSSQEQHLLSLIEPIIYDLENCIQNVFTSQTALNRQLDQLMITIEAIKSNPDLTLVLEDKSKKLLSLKRRLTLVHTIVQNANERCRKLIVNNKLVVNADNK